MILCSKCGNQNEVSLGQTACFRCGAELPAEPPSVEPVIQPAVPNESPQPSKSFWRFEDRGTFTLNGFGTTYYGMRDFRADGSYITTEWIVLAYIPLIPTRSLRVSYRGPGERHWYLGVGSSEKYAVFEKRFPPNWRQVLCTYSYVALLIGWIYFACTSSVSMFPHALDTVSGVTMIFIVCILPVPTPWIFRHFAQKKVYERHDA